MVDPALDQDVVAEQSTELRHSPAVTEYLAEVNERLGKALESQDLDRDQLVEDTIEELGIVVSLVEHKSMYSEGGAEVTPEELQKAIQDATTGKDVLTMVKGRQLENLQFMIDHTTLDHTLLVDGMSLSAEDALVHFKTERAHWINASKLFAEVMGTNPPAETTGIRVEDSVVESLARVLESFEKALQEPINLNALIQELGDMSPEELREPFARGANPDVTNGDVLQETLNVKAKMGSARDAFVERVAARFGL